MEFTIWLSYVTTVLILVITPGPSVLLATANSMKHGSDKAIGTILGDLSANTCQILLASLGLASFVISSAGLFQVIKWCGVAYLIYMGTMKFISKSAIHIDEEKTKNRSFSKLYAEGFLMSASNPKAIVFFAALFPLFINETSLFWPQVLILGVTFLIMDGTSLLIYTRFASKLKVYLENQEKMHLQNRIIGTLLICSAIMLSIVKRTQN